MKTQKRRTEIEAGAQTMLLANGWTLDWQPKREGDEPPAELKCWVNPRTKRRFTKQAAIDIEELGDSL